MEAEFLGYDNGFVEGHVDGVLSGQADLAAAKGFGVVGEEVRLIGGVAGEVRRLARAGDGERVDVSATYDGVEQATGRGGDAAAISRNCWGRIGMACILIRGGDLPSQAGLGEGGHVKKFQSVGGSGEGVSGDRKRVGVLAVAGVERSAKGYQPCDDGNCWWG